MSEKIKEWPGSPYKEERFAVRWRPEAKYGWTTGIAIGRFLEGLKDGKLLGRKCKKCNRVLVPPRMFCELCFRATDRWVEVGDRGKILTYSIAYVSADVSKLEQPLPVAVIQLDGASEGIGILHKVRVEPERIRFGMRVRAVWKPRLERRGAITDIECFIPEDD
jgi:hypothetical protein